MRLCSSLCLAGRCFCGHGFVAIVCGDKQSLCVDMYKQSSYWGFRGEKGGGRLLKNIFLAVHILRFKLISSLQEGILLKR